MLLARRGTATRGRISVAPEPPSPGGLRPRRRAPARIRSAAMAAHASDIAVIVTAHDEAEDAGTVKEIRCKEGESVSEGDTLVVLD